MALKYSKCKNLLNPYKEIRKIKLGEIGFTILKDHLLMGYTYTVD